MKLLKDFAIAVIASVIGVWIAFVVLGPLLFG